MISTKLSLQNLALVLVVFTVFTVSLTETIQISDGFSAVSKNFVFDMQRGETQVATWEIVNDNAKKTWVEFYTSGEGGDLILFDEVLEMDGNTAMKHEFIISIPTDHPDNVTYKPDVIALKRGEPVAYGVTGAQINMELKTRFLINIGDNPIYTPPPANIPVETPTEIIIPEKEAYEKEQKETLAEKMARINAANEARVAVMGETPAQATGQFEVEDPVTDYVPEPVTEINPVGTFSEEEEGGGCLIATATFGSELAPQVQLLREIRDNQLMGTSSGMAFMSGFNSLYYSFSPVIADMERESPIFKELVKITITPMISTLSVMEYADSDDKVLGLGIGVILMNLGMYVGLPTFGLVKLLKTRK